MTLLAALLAAATLAAFCPVFHNGFISWDDGEYVRDNPWVNRGLTWDGVAWAFQSTFEGNWHPLTWLSHMLDVAVFGLNPGWHHAVSLLFHIANSVLLFLLFHRLTGAVWRAALVAALFALHPLHVESVVWIAERKDVLSTFFFLLTLITYVEYVKANGERRMVNGAWRTANGGQEEESREQPVVPRPTSAVGRLLFAIRWYFLALALFALGLMSKPMLVTLPFVLLLLDFWPLGRLGPGVLRSKAILRLIGEKVPFLALTAGACAVALLAQDLSFAMAHLLSPATRLSNAVASYAKYLGQAFWPANLAIFYPHPDICFPSSRQWPGWQIAAAGAALGAVSIGALAGWRRRPWLAVGWFWFLGTLVPVIGFVQVGSQAMADRYTYIPLIGVFLALVWSAAQWAEGRRAIQRVCGLGALLAIGACAVATHRQVGFWRDYLTVFRHALDVTRDNALAHYQVGLALGERNEIEPAMREFRAALAIFPVYADPYYGLAVSYQLLGRKEEAVENYQKAVSLRPWNSLAHGRFGALLWELGRHAEAVQQFEQALQCGPDNCDAHHGLGVAAEAEGKWDEAIAHYAAVARRKPDFQDTPQRLAALLLRQGRLPQAEQFLRQLVSFRPGDAEARINLGGVLWRLKQPAEALEQYEAAVRLNPLHPVAHYNKGFALAAAGRLEEAIAELREAVRLKPDYVEALGDLSRYQGFQGQWKEAAAALRELARLRPADLNARLNLANALLRAAETNEAAAAFAAVRNLDPSLASRLVEEGKALAARSLSDQALLRFETALQLEPANAEARQRAAEIRANRNAGLK